MRMWWTDDPADPDVMAADDPDVRRLVAAVAPGSEVTTLGGTMSLNLRLHSVGLVLRVHQSFVSRQRILALQGLRRSLLAGGLQIGEPHTWRGKAVLTCRGRLAELETYVPHQVPEDTWASYFWMFRAMGRLHRALTGLDIAVPKPVVATYAPPGSVRRWLAVTAKAVERDPEATKVVQRTHQVVGALRARWVPASVLPHHLVHGDVRRGNFSLTAAGKPVYFDFGFAARRPRIHDLAYALAWLIPRRDGAGAAEEFEWENVPRLIGEYEDAAHTTLTAREREALVPYAAAIPVYHAAILGYAADPVRQLRNPSRLAFLGIGQWLLDNPHAVLGSA